MGRNINLGKLHINHRRSEDSLVSYMKLLPSLLMSLSPPNRGIRTNSIDTTYNCEHYDE